MTAPLDLDIPTSSLAQPDAAQAKKFSINFKISGWAEALALFCFALLLRGLYAVTMQHLVFQNGDAFFFLAGGSSLLALATQLFHGNWHALSEIGTAIGPDTIDVMRSTRVADRVIADGPVIAGFSACMQMLAGAQPGSLLFNGPALKMISLNAVVDSLSCLCIYLFARKTGGPVVGRIAGILISIYPAAILNIHSFYSETCCSALLSAWLLACSFFGLEQHRDRAQNPGIVKTIGAWGLGVLSGWVMLSKPLFIYVPPFAVACIMLVNLFNLRKLQVCKINLRRVCVTVIPITALFIGLLCTFLPWYAFTNHVTGRILPGVYRSPAFNLFLGNDVQRDGWRSYPLQTGITSQVRDVGRLMLDSAKEQPLAFASLQVRKVARLWTGPWNEYRATVLGVPLEVQEVFHQLLLMVGAGGAILLLGSGGLVADDPTNSLEEREAGRLRSVGALLVSVIVAHCAYALFEPIPRYAFSAMPEISVLAAFALASLFTWKRAITATFLCGSALCIVRAYPQLNACLEAIFPNECSPVITALTVAFAWSTLFLFFVWTLVDRNYGVAAGQSVAVRQSFRHSAALAGVVAVAGMISLAVGISSDREIDQMARMIDSHSRQLISRTFTVSDSMNAEGVVYLLVDMQAHASPCPVRLSINGTQRDASAIPWLAINQNPNYMEVMPMHLQGMGLGLTDFPQWWAVPVPAGLLRPGELNEIDVSPCAQDRCVTVFGARSHAGKLMFIPSLQLTSWTKGFATADHRDGRVYDEVRSSGHERPGTFVPHMELVFVPEHSSTELIQQCTPNNGTSNDGEVLFQLGSEHPIAGANPLSAQLAPLPVPLPQWAGSRDCSFVFRFEVRPVLGDHRCAANLTFTAERDGKPIIWQSPWQSTNTQLSPHTREWFAVSYCDRLPEQFRGATNVKVNVQIMPFDPDTLFLNRRRASKQAIVVRSVELKLYSSVCSVSSNRSLSAEPGKSSSFRRLTD